MTQAARIQKLEGLLDRVQRNTTQPRGTRPVAVSAGAVAELEAERGFLAPAATSSQTATLQLDRPAAPTLGVDELDEAFAADAGPIEDVELLDEDILDLTEPTAADEEQEETPAASAHVAPAMGAAAEPAQAEPTGPVELPAVALAQPEAPVLPEPEPALVSSPVGELVETPAAAASLSLGAVAPTSAPGWSEPPAAALPAHETAGTELVLGTPVIEEAEIPPAMPIGVSGASPTEEQLGQVVELEAPLGPALELDTPPPSLPAETSDELEADLVMGGPAGAAIPLEESMPPSAVAPSSRRPTPEEAADLAPPPEAPPPASVELATDEPVKVSPPIAMLRGPVVQVTSVVPAQPATFQQWLEESLSL